MPFFGGVRHATSEAECPEEAFPNLDLVNWFWRLSLPADATRYHPAANSFGPDNPDLGSVDFPLVLVVVGGLDLIRDCTVELAEFTGKSHGFYLHEPGSEATAELIQTVARFVDNCGAVAALEAGRLLLNLLGICMHMHVSRLTFQVMSSWCCSLIPYLFYENSCMCMCMYHLSIWKRLFTVLGFYKESCCSSTSIM
jgi:hypothetical protein